jgi:hypothetical protein
MAQRNHFNHHCPIIRVADGGQRRGRVCILLNRMATVSPQVSAPQTFSVKATRLRSGGQLVELPAGCTLEFDFKAAKQKVDIKVEGKSLLRWPLTEISRIEVQTAVGEESWLQITLDNTQPASRAGDVGSDTLRRTAEALGQASATARGEKLLYMTRADAEKTLTKLRQRQASPDPRTLSGVKVLKASSSAGDVPDPIPFALSPGEKSSQAGQGRLWEEWARAVVQICVALPATTGGERKLAPAGRHGEFELLAVGSGFLIERNLIFSCEHVRSACQATLALHPLPNPCRPWLTPRPDRCSAPRRVLTGEERAGLSHGRTVGPTAAKEGASGPIHAW